MITYLISLYPSLKANLNVFCLSINRPDRINVERTVFAWEDTKDARTGETSAYVILNDEEHSVSENALSALRAYKVNPVLWTGRHKVREELAA